MRLKVGLVLSVLLLTWPARATADPQLPNWFVSGIVEAVLDPAAGMAAETVRLPLATEALGRVNLNDLSKRRAIVDVLTELLQSEDVRTRAASADALGRIRSYSPDQRRHVIDALLVHVRDDDRAIMPEAALSIARIGISDPQERDAFVDILIGDLSSRSSIFESAAEAVTQIQIDNPKKRAAVIDTLLSCLSNEECNRLVSIRSLVRIQIEDQNRKKMFIDILLKFLDLASKDLSGDEELPILAANELGKISFDSLVDRELAIDALTRHLHGPLLFPAMHSLNNIKILDPKKHEQFEKALVKELCNGDGDIGNNSPLFPITIDDPAGRERVIDALIERLGSKDHYTAETAAKELSWIRLDDQRQRHKAREALSAREHRSEGVDLNDASNDLCRLRLRNETEVDSLAMCIAVGSTDDVLALATQKLVEIKSANYLEYNALIENIIKDSIHSGNISKVVAIIGIDEKKIG